MMLYKLSIVLRKDDRHNENNSLCWDFLLFYFVIIFLLKLKLNQRSADTQVTLTVKKTLVEVKVNWKWKNNLFNWDWNKNQYLQNVPPIFFLQSPIECSQESYGIKNIYLSQWYHILKRKCIIKVLNQKALNHLGI